MITRDQLERWLKRLRSGEYAQGMGNLKLYNGTGNEDAKVQYCCLGVLAEILCEDAVLEEDAHMRDEALTVQEVVPAGYRLLFDPEGAEELFDTLLPSSIVNADTQQELAQLNDSGHSFNHIADTIEAMPNTLTKEG